MWQPHSRYSGFCAINPYLLRVASNNDRGETVAPPIGRGGRLITTRGGIRHTFFGIATAPHLLVARDGAAEIRRIQPESARSRERMLRPRGTFIFALLVLSTHPKASIPAFPKPAPPSRAFLRTCSTTLLGPWQRKAHNWGGILI